MKNFVSRPSLATGSARFALLLTDLWTTLDFQRESATIDTMRKASLADLEQPVTMMTEFYSDSPYTLNPRRATDAFTARLADERLGQVWFIQSNSEDVGSVVVTLCHSMTFGGMAGVVDDFFIQAAFRGVGLGKAAMEEVRSHCAEPRYPRHSRGRPVETTLLPWRSIGALGSRIPILCN